MEFPGEAGLEWLEASGEHAAIVLSTRIRLARNLQGHVFGPRAGGADREAVFEKVAQAAASTDELKNATLHGAAELAGRAGRLLLERRLLTRELLGEEGTPPRAGAGLVLSRGAASSILVNEEDHLRIQVLRSGLDLSGAWNQVDLLDESLGRQMAYAWHPEFGFLTSCPTNVGTGLRASVLLHLPALVLTREIGKVLKGLTQMGLTFRGLHGEGSEVVGNFFQVSNQVTLGRSEEALVDHLEHVVRRVIHYEEEARRVLLRDAGAVTEDKVWRAYGLLRHARSLSFEELVNLLSGVRLGAGLKLLPGLRVYPINKILMFTQPGHLEEAAGRDLSPTECDAHRAAYVRRILLDEGVVESEDGGSGGPGPLSPPEAPPG